MTALRIGTRGSPLALWQANHVADLLRAVETNLRIELVTIQTAGDQVRDAPLAQIGGEGVFTKAIQDAVREGRADIAVHSLKDLPTFAVAGLVLAAVPKRGPVGDVLVAKANQTIAELPTGAIIGTSSVRRRAQLLHRRPDLKLVEMRGNVETRLHKLDQSSEMSGIVLAQAGLVRLGLADRITEVLDRFWMLPAVGQGALGLECRTGDHGTMSLLMKIDHAPTRWTVLAERAMLRALGGGCQVPIGAEASVRGNDLSVRGVVLTPDGSVRVEDCISGPITDAERLGEALAASLLKKEAPRPN